ncbi:aspartate aminotransferase family protein [Paenibacillus thiaminolyticus]|uniref:aspartate aminotransferase family protein n=1 Tax=Paenibacillus thiaminolyticus TaxID=49283 RepID=UPI00232AC949|nr:aspartate aminotransferase family protein [Paenibacillus thiaminolyticus]WCF08078.1 aspartate aminotransferase family protein [Paenibacillus thiaminolyticus]
MTSIGNERKEVNPASGAEGSAAFIGPEGVLAKRRAYFYPCTQHFYRQPPQIVRGSMQYLYDHEGRRYTDFFAGVSVVACGHCNPRIAEASVKQLQTLQHTTTIYLTQPMADLAERLANGILPGRLSRTFFCNSGSEANEGALLLARLHTKRRDFLALEYGLHGRTWLTMGVTGLPMWRADDHLDEGGVTFIPRPYEAGLDAETAMRRSLEALKQALEAAPERYAAMIVEPIQGNGGMIVPPEGYFREVKALLEAYGVLLIADEIQTGFGRTGRMFALDYDGVAPDIVSMAKALGNGVPIGAFATTDEIAASFNRPSASTFGGNPVSSATALAVLDYIEEEGLVDRASRLGERLKQGLEELQRKHGVIADVRGRGLMLGAELQGAAGTESAALTDAVLEAMKERGFIIGKNGIGRNVLAFQPPLVIETGDIDSMLAALDDVLGGIEA